MGKFLWFVGLASLGVAAYVVYNDSLGVRTADGADDLSAQIGNWGTKSRVKGTGGVLGGKIEQGLGSLVGDPAVEGQGALDETVGRVKDAAGQAAHAVSDAIDNAKG